MARLGTMILRYSILFAVCVWSLQAQRVLGQSLQGQSLQGQSVQGQRNSQSSDLPNILWLTAEDMSPTLGCYGDRVADTPFLDAFAKESVLYTKAFATAPVCSPSRSCLITGVYATSLGTQRLRSAFKIPDSIHGFPSFLRQLGYFTSNNVKTDYNTSSESRLIEESWTVNGPQAHWRDRKTERKFFSVFNDMTTHQSRTMTWTFQHFQNDIQSQLAPGRRHNPLEMPVPEYYPDTPLVRKTLARFYDCVSVMDQNFGRRLEELEEDGLAEDTIVFFYSDHGSGLPRHKRLLLDSGMHVPLMIRFPKKFQHLAPAKPGEKVDRLVSFVDFAPTVLSLLSFKPPESMQGSAFLGKYKKPHREYVFGARDRVDEAYDLSRSVRDQRYLYVRNYKPYLSYNQPSAYSDLGEIRDEISRLAREGTLTTIQKQYAGPTRPIEELFDTESDPSNTKNLAQSEEHENVLIRMRQALEEWSLRTMDLGYLHEIPMQRLSKTSTPYEMARKSGAPPLRKIREAAEWVGELNASNQRQAGLRHANPMVRYWAVVAARIARVPISELQPMLNDDAPEVRIEAASAILSRGDDPQSLEVLVQSLRSDDENEVLAAARALQLSGERARSRIPAVSAARLAAKNDSSPIQLFIDFATTMHLVELGELDEESVFQEFR